MEKWEYRWLNGDLMDEENLSMLNALGKQGWEAVGFTSFMGTANGMLLKRRLSETNTDE